VLKIAVIPGDGIGPEVVREGLKVLSAVAGSAGVSYEITELDWGGERYLKTGEVRPANALDILREFDAIYLGAVGHPDVPVGLVERQILLDVRFGLDLYVNLRPIKLYPGVWTPIKDKGPEEIDFVVVRENTEDMYVGMGGFAHYGTADEVATQVAIYTRKGTERIIRYAFELARRRGASVLKHPKQQRKVTLVDKSNVLTYGHDLWQRTFREVATDYPDIEVDRAYVDAACMWMVKNPEWFDVIVTTNMFGDIITDLGAMIQGGMGVAASGNINPQGGAMFEPIHGSAPKYAGKNQANPIASIAAMGMLLDHAGAKAAAARIDGAIAQVLASGRIPDLSAGKCPPTSVIGDMIAGAAA
jgi:3-isopropylmalate dehydrogenase